MARRRIGSTRKLEKGIKHRLFGSSVSGGLAAGLSLRFGLSPTSFPCTTFSFFLLLLGLRFSRFSFLLFLPFLFLSFLCLARVLFPLTSTFVS